MDNGLEERLRAPPLQPELTIEVRVVFDDKEHLDTLCKTLLGTHITGYTLQEHQTTYLWDGKQETKTNYLASTTVPLNIASAIVRYFHQEISKHWKTPFIQVVPCFVLPDLYRYFQKNY